MCEKRDLLPAVREFIAKSTRAELQSDMSDAFGSLCAEYIKAEEASRRLCWCDSCNGEESHGRKIA